MNRTGIVYFFTKTEDVMVRVLPIESVAAISTSAEVPLYGLVFHTKPSVFRLVDDAFRTPFTLSVIFLIGVSSTAATWIACDLAGTIPTSGGLMVIVGALVSLGMLFTANVIGADVPTFCAVLSHAPFRPALSAALAVSVYVPFGTVLESHVMVYVVPVAGGRICGPTGEPLR